MKKQVKKMLAMILILSAALSLFVCRAKTDEDLILELMDHIDRLAEKKDIAGLMANLADDYSDFEARDKNATQAMVKDYFAHYKGIVIHMLSTRIDHVDPLAASIQTEAALSSGAAEVFRKLVRFSTDNYRFKFKLAKAQGAWKIQYAEWRYVSLNELYPESMTILKKIFPGI
jgi:hypothetical protein